MRDESQEQEHRAGQVVTRCFVRLRGAAAPDFHPSSFIPHPCFFRLAKSHRVQYDKQPPFGTKQFSGDDRS